MIKSIHIKNYKIFEEFDLELNSELNTIVGDNEAGKSTILEAINLALTKRLNGKNIDFELSPFLFNYKCTKTYFDSLKTTSPLPLPKILIEIYLNDDADSKFRGTMNSKKEDCPGIKLEIHFDEEYTEDYAALLKQADEVKLIPTEFYKVDWYYFSNNPVTARSQTLKVSYIDTTAIHLQSGTDYYLQDIIKNELSIRERVGLNIAYRNLKESFGTQSSIQTINSNLTQKKGTVSNKNLTISIDISQKSNWETNLVPHLDELPFHFSGKGEQSTLKMMLALERKAEDSELILIEEPENHLSFSSMNILINQIREKCKEKQILITTHDAYVLNKLGINNLILLNNSKTVKLEHLSVDTQKYFKILSGYDTLRLVLAKRCILVEGPSDELIVQKAYKTKHNHLPIEDGVDIINVRGLSFIRFLEIADKLVKNVNVVTDNDGDFKKNIEDKYLVFKDKINIKINFSEDNTLTTLEPHLLAVNTLTLFNSIFNTSYTDDKSLLDYMVANKTECALKLFEPDKALIFPDYINEAIS